MDELVRRRIVVISCIAWLPLLLLSVFAGHGAGDAVKVPFLYDLEAHVRFLVALPILIAAEPSAQAFHEGSQRRIEPRVKRPVHQFQQSAPFPVLRQIGGGGEGYVRISGGSRHHLAQHGVEQCAGREIHTKLEYASALLVGHSGVSEIKDEVTGPGWRDIDQTERRVIHHKRVLQDALRI